MDSEQAAQTATFFSFVKNLAEVSVVLGAGFYLIGWSYLYGYYHGFGLSSDNLNFSVDSVLVHSIPVIWNPRFLVTAIIVMVALWVVSRFRAGARLLSQVGFVPLLLLFTGLVVSGYASGVGRDNARRDAYLSTTTLPNVTLEGAEDLGTTGCTLAESKYRLLLHTSGQVFVILPVDSTETLTGLNMRVCSFPDSRIQAMRLQVGLGGR
jgi:hypothetical protein